MVQSPKTPRASEERAQYEFTPIGHANVKDTSALGTLDGEPKKRTSNSDELQLSLEKDDNEPRKKSRKADDTLNSTRIFNESSFDDTLPSHAGIPSLRKVRSNEILADANGNIENLGASNPLKEQQNSLYKLNVENYNLRVKCNSLLKFLNNVTDEGELKENLAIMDELQDWKIKYQKLASTYRDLQLRIDSNDEGKDAEDQKRQTALQNAQLAELEAKLNNYKESVNNSRDLISRLEKELTTSSRVSNARKDELELNIRSLREQIEKLEAQIADKNQIIKDNEQKIRHLNDSLKRQSNVRETLEDKIEQQLQKVEALENKTRDYELQVRELQEALANTKDELKSQTQGKNTRSVGVQSRIEGLEAANSKLKSEIDQNMSEKRESQSQLEKLKAKSNDMLNGIEERDEKINLLKREIQELKQQESNHRSSSQKEKSLNDKIHSLKAEIQGIVKEKDELQRDNDNLRERIVTQATRSPALKENRKLQERAIDNAKLQARLQDLEKELSVAKKAASAARQSHHVELERLQAQMENSDMEPLIIKRKLDKEISILRLELDSLRETKDREITLLESRCQMLIKENEHVALRADANVAQNQKQIVEKQKEIDDLVQRCSNLTTEKLKLNKELSQTQESEADKNRELSKLTSRLEFVTKEFVRYRETHSSNPDSSNAKLNERWTEKYRNMKQKLLEELKILQDENLGLERRLLEGGSHVPRSASPDLNKLSLQDQVDYYKLRYRHQVIRNSDMKVMNEYLNRVLRASSQHVRLDIMKLENEALTDLWPDFPHRGRLRFKTVALMVLAAVRIERAAQKVRWDAQRINYLRQKIVLDQDRVTW
ncbi:LAME_0D02520g1_1 [Lachancea meyersii CBS 8951]|uniref:Spindle pole body component 110 n=1 Tax=Lachancea meyersii CBS 8951 TaxID=1266667 RepID=A0A1G4J7F9_9SACH|nr:LAME_0D02520g1_1 [Lachancea meyersii CBS 8951]